MATHNPIRTNPLSVPIAPASPAPNPEALKQLAEQDNTAKLWLFQVFAKPHVLAMYKACPMTGETDPLKLDVVVVDPSPSILGHVVSVETAVRSMCMLPMRTDIAADFNAGIITARQVREAMETKS